MASPFWLPGAAATPPAASVWDVRFIMGQMKNAAKQCLKITPVIVNFSQLQFCLEMVGRNSDVCDFLNFIIGSPLFELSLVGGCLRGSQVLLRKIVLWVQVVVGFPLIKGWGSTVARGLKFGWFFFKVK